MTILFLQPWNGYQVGQQATLGAPTEGLLTAGGIATADLDTEAYAYDEVSINASMDLRLTDANSVLACNSASAINITIPAEATTKFLINDIITIYQLGAGASTFVAGAGVTLQGTAPTPTQYVHIAVRYRGGDIWAWV